VGYLAHACDELRYGEIPLPAHQRVLGEGAAALLVESRSSALVSGHSILAEILGSGMTHEPGPLLEGCQSEAGLLAAIEIAYARSGVDPRRTKCILRTPQGNEDDRFELLAIERYFDRYGVRPLQHTTVFRTGYAESVSVLFNVVALLNGWRDDAIRLPGHVLITASTHMGYHYALILEVM